MGDRPTILLTGATGNVGGFLRPRLRDAYRLILHYHRRPPADLASGEAAVQADITDLQAVVGLAAGADAIIHLAGEARSRASWEAVRGPNIEGAYAIFEAARLCGVRRVIFASTNHVMGGYDLEGAWPIDPAQPVRPDGLYGASKAFGEALGRYYADAFGIAVICLRIGWVLERPFDEQGLRMWLSPDDLGRLVRRSLEAPVSFGIYYGVSRNTRGKWRIENAARDLGYDPQDNSELFAADILSKLPA